MGPKWLFRLVLWIIVRLYVATSGRIGGRFMGMPILLLTTTGRRSGRKRTVPVMYLRDGDNYVVTASNGGSDFHPAWYLNLTARPQVAIREGGDVMEAASETVRDADKEQLWRELVRRAPFFGGYQRRTSRIIPMVRIRPLPLPGPETGRG